MVVQNTPIVAVQGGSSFWFRGRNPKVWPFKWKLHVLSSTFLQCGCYYAVQGGSNVWVCGWNPKVWPWKLLHSMFLWCCYYTVQSGSNFWVCGWNPKVWPFKWKLHVLSSTFLQCGCYYAVQGGSNVWVCGWNPKVWPWKLLRCCYYAVQSGSNFWVCGWNPKVWPFKWKLHVHVLSSTFLWCCLLFSTRWF